ncbi:MAG: sensor histidine kinase [Pseudomonadota bacterium]
MEPLRAWWVSADESEQIVLESDRDMVFSDRTEATRYMTGELTLSASEAGTLFVRYVSGGNTALPVALGTPDSLAATQYREATAMALFTGAILTLVLVNAFQFVAVRKPAYLFYSAQETLAGLYIAHMEGFTFQYLWPDAPMWNAAAAPILGTAMLLSAALFMRSFLDLPRTAPRLNMLALAYIGIYVLVLLAQPFIDKRLGNTLGLWGGVIIFPTLLATGLWFSLVKRERSAHFYLLGWLAAGIGGLYFSAEQLDYLATGLRGIDGLKIGVAMEALILSIALADQVRALRVQRDRNQRELLSLAETRLIESQELVAAERERRLALERAQQADERLANTGHDLRNPLFGLRLALRNARGLREDGAMSEQLEQTFSYIDDLLAGLSNEYHEKASQTAEPLSATLTRCQQRQSPAAKDADVTLRVQLSSLQSNASTKVLDRILDNLVGNAIRYSAGGKVLLGVRRRRECLEIQICDQGPGIRAEVIESLRQRFTRGNGTLDDSSSRKAGGTNHRNGDEPAGFGLGLAIVDKLCEEIGARLTVQSKPGAGSVFSIFLPRVSTVAHASDMS